MTKFEIFSVKGTRPDTHHKLFAVIASACLKKRLQTDRPAGGRTDRQVHPLIEPQLIGKKAKQIESFTGFSSIPLKLMYIRELFSICHATKLARN